MSTNFITQHRRGTAEEWEASNIIPYEGEVVLETFPSNGSFKIKIGDGKNTFVNLPYHNLDKELEELKQYVDGKVVDGLLYQNNLLYLTLNGEIISEPVEITGGSGGGASYSVRLVSKMPSNTLVVAASDKTLLTALFYEYYGDVSTGVNGMLEVSYKLADSEEWIVHGTQSVEQDKPFSINVASMLTLNKATNIKFKVTAGESDMSRTLMYTVTQIEASISTINFNSAAVYTGNIDVQYKCVGRDLQKTVYFEIDNEVCDAIDVGTSHNAILSHTIQMLNKYSYGSHDLRIWFETPDGAKSNVLEYAVLYNDGTGTQPIIGVVCEDNNITYGEPLSVTYVVYTPGQETTNELNIRVYGMDNGNEVVYERALMLDVANNIPYAWQCMSYPLSGQAYVEFTSGDTRKVIIVTINEMETEYNLAQVATNLVYSYTANGRGNNDANKELYECAYTTANGINTVIEGKFNDFNWVSNGYVDGESLTLSGDARHIIELPMFSTSYTDRDGQTISLESVSNSTVTTNGRTFEIEFKVSNVTDIEAHIIECLSSEHAGFVVTPQNCYLLSSNGANVQMDDTGFIENEESIAAAYIRDNTRIRLSFVIEPRGSVQYTLEDGTKMSGQCINIYINGQFANSHVYPDNARFLSQEYIKMGSNTCILNVYDVRIYNRGLNEAEILQNYNASPMAVQDKLVRFEDNDVLNDDGDVDYDKAIYKYPCLLATGPLSPYKGAHGVKMEGKVESGWTLTKPDGNGGYTVEWDLLDKDLNGNWVSCNNVQGTSSQKFPLKNYKVYLVQVLYNEDGTPQTEEKDGVVKVKTKKVKYSLKGKDANGNDLSIGESTLCFKADYMSSDHANTFNANLADTLFDDVTESQRLDPRVQNTIWGFRCLLFRRDDVDAPIEFISDGALNNDKGNTKTFGLERSDDDGNDTTCQKWEFLNNTEALTSFQTDRLFEEVVSEGKTVLRATQGLESTYPDQGDLKDEGLTPKYDYIQVLFTWVYQRANFWDASTDVVEQPYVYRGVNYYTEREYRKAIFINEFEKHFNKNHALIYYLFMEFVALCDNRAKNMFLRSENVRVEQLLEVDGNEIDIMDCVETGTGVVNAERIDWENSTFAIWLTDLYDLDSGYGVENSGYMQIPYYADWNYHLNGTQKFNGRESRLWLMIEEAFADDITAKAQVLTERGVGEGGLNYDTLYDMHIRNNAMLVCPAIVNQDMISKYSDPWIEGFVDYSTEGYPIRHISDYKYLQRGSRTQQKDAFIYRRSNMLYSKYRCKKFLNNNINFRCGANGGVPASESGISITANQVLYPAVKFGDGDAAVVSGVRTNAGDTTIITKPSTTDADKVGFSDTVYIAGGTFLTDIGNISKFHPYELQLQNATGLRVLNIGSDEEGYANVQLKNIDTSGCKLLEELNIMGCVALGALDLSRNGLLKKVYAANSSVQSVILPNGGVLEELHLGDIVDLEILNQPNIEAFDCTSYDSLIRLHIENTPIVPVFDILQEKLPELVGGIRLIGIDETLEDASLFDRLTSAEAQGKYIDNSGVLVDDMTLYPYISGKCHIRTLSGTELQKIKQAYPDIEITYDTLTANIIYMNEFGTEELYRETIINGQAIVDPVERGMIEIPTKASTAQYHFIYGGWSIAAGGEPEDNVLSGITLDITVYAAFNKVVRSYTVNFYNGDVLLQTSSVEYGTAASYHGDTPVKTNTSMPELYIFTGWDPVCDYIVGDLNCYAQFEFDTTNIYKFLLSDFQYNIVGDTTMSITKYIGKQAAGEVQAVYDGNKVTAIGGFEESFIEFIILPDTLITISANAFQYCSKLTSIHIPANVEVIGNNAFRGCLNLDAITVSSNNKTYFSADNCVINNGNNTLVIGTNMSTIPADGSVTQIGYGAFYGRSRLQTINIPNGVTNIENTAFTNCSGLVDVILPDTLTNIGSMAFYGCAMNEIVIPNSVQNIRMYAFSECHNLTTVTIGSGITSLHAQAFDGSPNITTINVPWSEGEVANAPWGATNATINYNCTT
jgi:hypothetical protein